jgi:hypothetical protein
MKFVQRFEGGSWHNLDAVARYWGCDREDAAGTQRIVVVNFFDGYQVKFKGEQARQVEQYLNKHNTTLESLVREL